METPPPRSLRLAELQLLDKSQWSSTAAMTNYLHDDDDAGKQDAQLSA
jgi:hypothetical protein